jgi:NADH-quinone oxidoreductase subunit B
MGGERGDNLVQFEEKMGLEQYIPRGVLLTAADKMVNWARSSSVWPLAFGTACCSIEALAAFASRFDMARFGMEVYRASPRQADLMIVAGRVSNKMAPVVRTLYEQMAEPKWVIALGACASTGGVFNNYAIVQGADRIVPVDIYVPGCPPRPEQLIDGVMKLHEKIRHESVRGHKAHWTHRSTDEACDWAEVEPEAQLSEGKRWV